VQGLASADDADDLVAIRGAEPAFACYALPLLSRLVLSPQTPLRVLGSGDVLGVSSVQRLHHLDAEAGTVSEEHRELGHGSPEWLCDAG